MSLSQLEMLEIKNIVNNTGSKRRMDYSKMTKEDSMIPLKYITPEVSYSVVETSNHVTNFSNKVSISSNTARRGKKWSFGQRRGQLPQIPTNNLTRTSTNLVSRSKSNVVISLNTGIRPVFPIAKKAKLKETDIIVIEDSDSDDECQIVCVTYPRKPLIMAPEINRKKSVKVNHNYDDDDYIIALDDDDVPSIAPRPVRSCRARKLGKERREKVVYPELEPEIYLPDKLDKELFFNSLGLSKNGLPVSDPLKPLPYKSIMPSMIKQHASKCLTIVQVPKMVQYGMLPKKALITKEQLDKSAEFIKTHTLTNFNDYKRVQHQHRNCIVLVQRLTNEEILRWTKKI